MLSLLKMGIEKGAALIPLLTPIPGENGSSFHWYTFLSALVLNLGNKKEPFGSGIFFGIFDTNLNNGLSFSRKPKGIRHKKAAQLRTAF
jgi:hypothetical protein